MLWLEIPAYAGSTISWSSQPPRRRIIPAYAGSTGGAGVRRAWRRDHPRIRGEHSSYWAAVWAVAASSPHTRGALHGAVKALIDERIIPAYAGSTGVDRVGHRGLPGSSPHTRGAQTSGASRDGSPGIIPAYAGSTTATSMTASASPDHPRIRGEHETAPSDYATSVGSSPHTRGARSSPPRKAVRGRIIPAYAGSTQ